MAATQTPFTVDVGGLTVRGTVWTPADGGQLARPHPGVVLFHGIGGQRMENARLFVDLARSLAAQGCTVLAWDRAGHGESDGEFRDTSVGTDVEHTRAVLDAFAARDDVDPGDLHLVGYSMGAVVAVTTAATTHHPIRSVTLWSAAAYFADDVRAGRLLGRQVGELDDVGYLDLSGQRLGRPFVDHARTFDPYAAAAGYRGPVLLVHGTQDFVPTSSATRYADVLTDATVDLVEGADHGWSRVADRDHVIAVTTAHVTAHVTTHSKD